MIVRAFRDRPHSLFLFAAVLAGLGFCAQASEDPIPTVLDVQQLVCQTLAGGASTSVDCQRALATALKHRAESRSGVVVTGESVSIRDQEPLSLEGELRSDTVVRHFVKVDAVGAKPIRISVPLGENTSRVALFRRVSRGLFLRASSGANRGVCRVEAELSRPGEYAVIEEREGQSLADVLEGTGSEAKSGFFDFTETTNDPAARQDWGVYRIHPWRINGPIPVVLVHGLDNDRWGEFITWATESPEAKAFREHFQLWNFYHAATGIDAAVGYSPEYEAFENSIVASFERFLREAEEDGVVTDWIRYYFPEGPFMMVTDSTGGVKVRAFLKNFPEYMERVLAVVSIAAPHSGTPVATPEWVRHTFSRMVTADPTLGTFLLSGVLAEFFTTSFMRVDRQSDLDMGWGNFDAQGGFGLPTADFEIWRPGTGIVQLTVSPRDACQTYARLIPGIPDTTFEPPALRDTFCGGIDEIMPSERGEDGLDKFFAYASYLSEPRDWLGIVQSAKKAYEVPERMKPLPGFLQNKGLELANLAMGSMASAGSDVPLGVYAVNDGLIPLQSALFLDGKETELIYETEIGDDGYEYPVIPYQLRMDIINEHTLFNPERLRILQDWTHLDTATGRYNRWTRHSELYSMVAADLISALP